MEAKEKKGDTGKELAKPKKDSPKFVELSRSARVVCSMQVGGKDREYVVTLVPNRKYEVVDDLNVEINPLSNKIRKSKLDEIRSELQIKS